MGSLGEWGPLVLMLMAGVLLGLVLTGLTPGERTRFLMNILRAWRKQQLIPVAEVKPQAEPIESGDEHATRIRKLRAYMDKELAAEMAEHGHYGSKILAIRYDDVSYIDRLSRIHHNGRVDGQIPVMLWEEPCTSFVNPDDETVKRKLRNAARLGPKRGNGKAPALPQWTERLRQT